jgi:RimJ/RimL family protein N-acetyltransferase
MTVEHIVPRRLESVEVPRTTRLALERLRVDHLEELCRFHQDARVMATLGGVRSEESTREWLEGDLAHWERHGFGIWVARLRSDGSLAGRGGLRHVRIGGRDEVELAYAIGAELWGRGLASELAETALTLGFERLGLPELVCFALPTNQASLRVMQKAGFAFEREVVYWDRPHRLHRLTAAVRGEPHYVVRLARPQDVAAIPAIERAGAQLFAGLSVAPGVFEDVTPEEDLREAQQQELLWVAIGPGDRPVGFALVEELAGAAHLDELDVHPAHGRRGLGAALVGAVCDGARARGLPAVTLTTFRELAWNAPFYRGLGFRALEPQELGPALEALVADEDAAGLPAAERVVMRFDTGTQDADPSRLGK